MPTRNKLQIHREGNSATVSLLANRPGPLATKLIQKVRKKSGRKLNALSEILRGPQARLSGLRMSERSHKAYVQVMEDVSRLVYLLRSFQELEPLLKALQDAEEEYQPGYPPISPLTDSFFHMWGYFDLCHGPERETLGSICLNLAQAFEAPPERLHLMQALCQSRMSLFQHQGPAADQRIQLRDLYTGASSLCHVPAGYAGWNDQIWYARLLPAASPEWVDVVMTTPYVIVGPDLQAWQDYLARQPAPLDHFKHPPESRYWTEYVFEGYLNHLSQAVFLFGLPDRPETRPHSPKFDRSTLKPYEAVARRSLSNTP